MQEITIGQKEYGQRLDKLLFKYLSKASSGFLYKMLRKKNITLNKKKASGNEILQMGDTVQIYFSDETLEKFRTPAPSVSKKKSRLSILYEDEHILLINKPTGMLSQKASPTDVSAVEEITAYLVHSGQITPSTLETFRPGICNRLDRNTSGILAAGKTLIGLQTLNQAFADRSLHKYYLCPVQGIVREPMELDGYLEKDPAGNKVHIETEPFKSGTYVRTRFQPVAQGRDATLLEVELITGKTHQIRAHLASISHPIFGDFKYGNPVLNQQLRERFGLKHQLLHAHRLEFPDFHGPLANVSGKSFTAPLPKKFKQIWDDFET